MAIQLIVAGTPYTYPESGEEPNWSGGATDWAIAVTAVLNTLVGPNDILSTTFTVNNDISVITNINGLLFDPGTVRAANINYAIYRTSTANPAGNAETGTIYLIFDNSASVGNKWQLGQRKIGESGISFSITDSGQLQYQSSDIGTTGYFGEITFSAKTLDQ